MTSRQRMFWLQISIDTVSENAAAVEEAFTVSNALSVSLSGPVDDPVLEPAPGATPLWPRVRVTGLFPGDVDPDRVRLQLLAAVGDLALDLRLATLADRDWASAWLQRAKPLRFGRRLWVVPRHLPGPAERGAVSVRLDPGLAFGTGSHPTTALCLEWLDAHPPGDARVIDFGCGSGILGIAAARLGADTVYCVDHDPQAHDATRANAAANGVAERVVVVEPERLGVGKADLVLANILLKPLLELAPLFARVLRPGGVVVLSGVLDTQRAELEAAYRAGFDGFEYQAREGWIRFTATRSASKR